MQLILSELQLHLIGCVVVIFVVLRRALSHRIKLVFHDGDFCLQATSDFYLGLEQSFMFRFRLLSRDKECVKVLQLLVHIFEFRTSNHDFRTDLMKCSLGAKDLLFFGFFWYPSRLVAKFLPSRCPVPPPLYQLLSLRCWRTKGM